MVKRHLTVTSSSLIVVPVSVNCLTDRDRGPKNRHRRQVRSKWFPQVFLDCESSIEASERQTFHAKEPTVDMRERDQTQGGPLRQLYPYGNIFDESSLEAKVCPKERKNKPTVVPIKFFTNGPLHYTLVCLLSIMIKGHHGK